MTAIWPDDRLDDEIRRFLERRWNDVGGAPTAADVVRTMRLHDASPRAPRRPVIRVAPLLAAAAVLVLVAASVAFVGSQRRADVSIQPSTGPTTSAPAVTPQAPVAPPAAIGPISVVRAEGSWGDDIVEVPGGFAAFTDHGYLESSDGTTWRQVVPPVPGDGPFEHVAGESEHWIWSQAERRAWRSPDFATWTEVGLGFLGIRSPEVEQLRLEQPVTSGPTTLVPWTVSPREGGAGREGLLVATEAGVEPIAQPWEAHLGFAVIDGRFVALGATRATTDPGSAQDAGLWDSADGRTWSYLGKPDGQIAGHLQLVDGIAVGTSNEFVAITGWSTGTLWGSDDGLSWHELGRAPGPAFAVDGAFVAVNEHDVFVSLNGEDWWTSSEARVALDSVRITPGFFSAYRAGPNWIAVPNENGPLTWLIGYGVNASPDVPRAPTAPPSPGPVQVSARPPRSSDALPWWSAPTPIGAISWATDDDHELKPGIYETPAGFATITSVEYQRGSRIGGYRESADGITWRRATAPVPEPRAGPFEHLLAGNEHWIWSASQLRAWRSMDYIDWTEVDLSAIAPPASIAHDVSLDLGEPATDGSTVIIPWSESAAGRDRSGLLVVVDGRVDVVDPPWDTDVALTWAGGQFFALRAPTAAWESRPETPGALWRSDDGRTWTDLGQPQGLPAWVGATVWLVDGSATGTGWPLVAIFDLPEVGADLWGSEDGAAWQWIGRAPGHVFVLHGAFVAIGPPFLAYSIGGRDWQYLETRREPWFGSAIEPTFGSAPPYRVGPDTIAVHLESAAWWTVLMRVDADR